MADWLKVRHVLVRSPKIRGLMRALRCKRHAALGLALDWLVWIDEQTEDGKTHLLPDELADEIGFRGCAEALIEVGWAALGSDGCVEAVEFGKHCGDSAKKRAENALRQARFKANNGKSNAKSVTEVTQEVTRNALPEKKRIEYSNTKGSSRDTVDIGAGGEAATPMQKEGELRGFAAWLAVITASVRAFREARTLHPEVEAAAKAAYARFPRAVEYAELLRAYYDSSDQEMGRGRRCWKPQSGQFFECLEDVIFKYAQPWQRWSGWKPNSQRKPAAPKTPPPVEAMSEEELAAALAEMRNAAGLGGAADGN